MSDLISLNNIVQQGKNTIMITQSEDLDNDSNLRLRDLEVEDIHDLFTWRNHPDIRKNSFNTDTLLWDEHEKWFKTKSKDPDTAIYIACYKNYKVGSIRFENKDIAIKVSVMLNPDFLGKGIGSKLINLATKKFINDRMPDKPIVAEIKKDNIASVKAFQKAGFKESHVTLVYSNE